MVLDEDSGDVSGEGTCKFSHGCAVPLLRDQVVEQSRSIQLHARMDWS